MSIAQSIRPDAYHPRQSGSAFVLRGEVEQSCRWCLPGIGIASTSGAKQILNNPAFCPTLALQKQMKDKSLHCAQLVQFSRLLR
jgi:hypothetical protein